ncbi:hypothetical protein [Nocardia cyriacigeorgica]|uniref:hypothetical protein n=1 Tax=Nocardia cyriacigeorgica TaxID=135487 RepID=UPI0024576EFE|nr:hypothetical protein [Nocardia cyriacigeorgica]
MAVRPSVRDRGDHRVEHFAFGRHAAPAIATDLRLSAGREHLGAEGVGALDMEAVRRSGIVEDDDAGAIGAHPAVGPPDLDEPNPVLGQ